MARKKPVTEQEIVAFGERLQAVVDEATDLGIRIRDNLDSEVVIKPEFLTKILTAVHDISELGRTASIAIRNNRRAAEIEAKLKR